LGVSIQSIAIQSPDDFEPVFGTILKDRPESLLVLADTVTVANRQRAIEFAARNRVPAIYEVRVFVDDGGLMSYGIDMSDHYRRAAVYVDKILKGAKPADLPVQQPTKFELVINMKTAKALGLTIPPSLLQRADQVIEQGGVCAKFVTDSSSLLITPAHSSARGRRGLSFHSKHLRVLTETKA
jgi:putative ABC transport system substrate-binding protein